MVIIPLKIKLYSPALWQFDKGTLLGLKCQTKYREINVKTPGINWSM